VQQVSAPRALPRALGLFDVVLLGFSAVVGSGVFFLPGAAAERMGPAAAVALIVGSVICVLVALCFAEVGSRFDATGGAYLFARVAYGGFLGFSVGWMSWWARLISWAALANIFAESLLPFLPSAGAWLQPVLVAAAILALTGANLRGVRLGARVLDVFTVAKVLPFVLFVAVGAFYFDASRLQPFAPTGLDDLGGTTILLLWAFVGFESIAVVAGEMKDPQRTVPRASVLVMALVTVLYLAVFFIAYGTHPSLPGSENPVAEAAAEFLGPVGTTVVAVGIAVSVFGTNCVSALVTPRCLYALAEQGQAPRALTALHPERRTPTRAILVSAAIALALGLTGTFETLAVISVVARLFQYVPTCVAVLVLRRREGDPDVPPPRFRLALGPAVPVAATLLCLLVVVTTEGHDLLGGLAAFAAGIPFYAAFGRSSA